jgi:hypothetical protein
MEVSGQLHAPAAFVGVLPQHSRRHNPELDLHIGLIVPLPEDRENDAASVKGCTIHHSEIPTVLEPTGVSKSIRTGRQEQELHIVQLSATRCSCIAIL